MLVHVKATRQQTWIRRTQHSSKASEIWAAQGAPSRLHNKEAQSTLKDPRTCLFLFGMVTCNRLD